MTTTTSGTVPSNGARIHYEIHGDGAGVPVILLHGAFMMSDTTWPALLPALAADRRVIAVDLRGHGRSTDADAPLTYESMADDVDAVLAHLHIERADVVGYSLGGVTAAGVAIRHAGRVRKLVVISAAMDKQGWEPQSLAGIDALGKDFAPPPLVQPYEKVAPDPKRWPVLVEKVKALIAGPSAWTDTQLKAVNAAALFVMGDRDGFRTERSLAIVRMMKNAQLAVVPGGDHFFPFTRADLMVPMVVAFLAAP